MPRAADRPPMSARWPAVTRMSRTVRTHPRLGAAMLMGLMALLVWALAGRSGTDDSLRRVQESGVLRVGLEATFPPFETTDGQGNFGGYDVDLAQALATELGVEARFENLSYDTLYDALAARRVDVLISMIVPEPERTQEVAYSPPYFDGGMLLVVAEPPGPVTGTQGLAGRRVAVEAGSIAEEEGRRLAGPSGSVVVLTYSEPALALAAVARGEADAAIADPVSLAAYRKAAGKVVAVGPRLTSEPYVIATRRQDRSLSREVERLVEMLRARGELDRLAAKWF